MPPQGLVLAFTFDAAAALGLLVLALVHRPEGRRELAEALLGAAGAGTLGLAAALHGGHLGLPRDAGVGPALVGTVGGLVYLVLLGRAVGRARAEAGGEGAA